MATVLRQGLVDVGGGRFERTDVVVDRGRILSVADAPACGTAVNCHRHAVVPGAAHANVAAPACSADEIYVRTLRGGIETLRAGATTVVDFLSDGEDALEPVVRAYRDVGLRALIGLAVEKPPGAVARFHRPDEGISVCVAPAGAERWTEEVLAGYSQLADGGAIAPGRPADLVLLDLESRAVDSVMVGGEWRVVNGVVKGAEGTAMLAAEERS